MISINVGSNVGRNTISETTFINVDLFAWPINVKADILALPFRNECVDQINCSHVIEHVSYRNAFKVLKDFRRISKPSVILFIVAPDMDRTKAINSPLWIKQTIEGGPNDGWTHKWTCSVRRLRTMLEQTGWVPTWIPNIPPGFPAKTHSWPSDLEARFVCRRDDWPWPHQFPPNFNAIQW